MRTTEQIIEGLRNGISFEKEIDIPGDEGMEYMTPINDDLYRHVVAGYNAQGGWGGSAQLLIKELLTNRNFSPNGWRKRTKR